MTTSTHTFLPDPLPDDTRLARASSPSLDAILGLRYPVLDHGWVSVVDYMGNVRTPAHAARTSTKGQDAEADRSLKADIGLLSHLMRERHTSPFEACSIRFVMKMPLFVARQIMRHRMAKPNEQSGRYSTLDLQFYLPEEYHPQDSTNKQMADASQTIDESEELSQLVHEFSKEGKILYERLLSKGVAREEARQHVGLNAYTVVSITFDLHNLLKFLLLRTAADVQPETRQYALMMETLAFVWVPEIMEMYARFMRDTVTLDADSARALAEFYKDATDPEGTFSNHSEKVHNILGEKVAAKVAAFRKFPS